MHTLFVRMRRLFAFGSLSSSALLFTACGNLLGGDCILTVPPGLTITVVDAITGVAPIAVPSLRVTDGMYVQELSAPNRSASPAIFDAAYGRMGMYTLLVRAVGFADFTQMNVRVERAGECTVLRTVSVTARPTRLPQP